MTPTAAATVEPVAEGMAAALFDWLGHLPWGWAAAALAALVLLPTLFVMGALLERSGPVRLRHWAEETGEWLLAVYRRPIRFAAHRYLLSLGAKLSPMVLFVAVSGLLVGLGVRGLPALGYALGVSAGVSVLGELLARRVVDRHVERSLSRLTAVYRALWWLLTPAVALVAVLLRLGGLPAVTSDEDEATDSEIEAFIDFGTSEGILEPGEGEMVWGIVDLAETEVRSVMTPRIDIDSAPADESLDQIAERFLASGHSRLPLFEGSIDRIVGVLHIRDVLRGLRRSRRPSAVSLSKPPLTVPETKRLDELLKEMQAGQQQLAVVIDEYGGTSGLVSLEDLVEEIVGEIADEHEVVEPEPRQLPDGAWRLDGRTPAEDLQDLFGVDLGSEAFETIGGLVLENVGSVPETGQVITSHGLRLTVEQVENRRILGVRVEKLPADAPVVVEDRARTGK